MTASEREEAAVRNAVAVLAESPDFAGCTDLDLLKRQLRAWMELSAVWRDVDVSLLESVLQGGANGNGNDPANLLTLCDLLGLLSDNIAYQFEWGASSGDLLAAVISRLSLRYVDPEPPLGLPDSERGAIFKHS